MITLVLNNEILYLSHYPLTAKFSWQKHCFINL